jgi:hypothetical protein
MTELKIDRWYNKYEKSWVVMLTDEEGNQVGTSFYVYSKKEALLITEEDFEINE